MNGGCLIFLKFNFLLLGLGYLALGPLYRGLWRSWIEVGFGVLFICPQIGLRWIILLCKFKDLLPSTPSASSKVTLSKGANGQMFLLWWFFFLNYLFNFCFSLLLCGPDAGRKLAVLFLGPRIPPVSVCFLLPCGQRHESWANFSLLAFHFASQIFARAAFEILVIVCGHWWVFESVCVHLPPGVMMWRNVRSVTPPPDLSDSRALRRLYHRLSQHYG